MVDEDEGKEVLVANVICLDVDVLKVGQRVKSELTGAEYVLREETVTCRYWEQVK